MAVPAATRGSVRTLDRAIRILDSLGERPLRLSEAAAASELDVATTLRLLRSLVTHGLAERDEHGRYGLGLRLLELARKAKTGSGVRELAVPVMRQLAEETHQTCFLLVLSGQEAVCIERTLPSTPIRIEFMDVGDRVSLTVGAGPKVLLAFADEETIARAVDSLPPERRTKLLAELLRIRTDHLTPGIGGHVPGTAAIGVPVWGNDGKVLAALSISGLLHQFEGERLGQLGTRVARAGEAINTQLRRKHILEAS